MTPGVLVPLGLFLLVYAGVAVLAIRRPLLARLAAREAVRRRGQTVLVVAGLMVGTATITAALVGGDSVEDSSVESFAYRNWGHIDLTARSTDDGFFPATIADGLATEPSVQAVTDGVAGGVEVFGSVSDLDRRQGTSGVVLVGFDPARQEPFGVFRLVDGGATTGEDLSDGEVIISRLLATGIKAVLAWPGGAALWAGVRLPSSPKPEPTAFASRGCSCLPRHQAKRPRYCTLGWPSISRLASAGSHCKPLQAGSGSPVRGRPLSPGRAVKTVKILS
jgi:hypothetical protein